MSDSAEDGNSPVFQRSPTRKTVLHMLYSGRISTQLAAEKLALLTVESQDLDSGLYDPWLTMINNVKQYAQHHQLLLELLAVISNLPPEQTPAEYFELGWGQLWREFSPRLLLHAHLATDILA